MYHLFIDTNVLIRFYAFTDDNLIEAEKFFALVEAKSIKLYVPEQVIDEYMRNSETQIAASMKELDKNTLSVPIPRFMDHYPEAMLLSQRLQECRELRKSLIKNVRDDAENKTVKADKLVQSILAKGEILLTDDAVVKRARLRRDIGNPPGKTNSLGDQINWESLIEAVPRDHDLHIISRDGDFCSKVDESHPSAFLVNEWKIEKKSDLYLYNSLGSFTKKHFPKIKIAADIVKTDAIKSLVISGSFASTHLAISKLEKIYDEITLEDAIILFDAAIDNGQISSIINDDDVKAFFDKLYTKFHLKTSFDLDLKLGELADYFAIPF